MEIPLIIPDKSKQGYWEIYQDHRIWHDESDISKQMNSFNKYKEVGKQYSMGGDWMNLEDGENKVRLVSDFKPYGVHYDDKTRKYSTCIGKDNGCEGCKAGLQLSPKFLGWAIDRTDGKVKILKLPYQVFKQIGEYANNEEYAFDNIPSYDFIITKAIVNGKTTYSTLASRKDTLITDQEQDEINEKVKDPQDIIDKMKAKVSNVDIKDTQEQQDLIQEDREVNAEDIPF